MATIPPEPAMSTTTTRLPSLDTLRGAAVLGILVANLPGFALPVAAYFSPAGWGGSSPADLAAWALTFILIEGKMRGLFAILFGASMLLVIQRADDRGDNGAALHLRRMATLFVIGTAHLYLIWSGDILRLYATVGVIALFFTPAPTRLLLFAAAAALLVAVVDGLSLVATPRLDLLERLFGHPPAVALATEIAALRGGWTANVAWRWAQEPGALAQFLAHGPETLAYMLLGMAGLRSGFLTGAWSRRRYTTIAAVALAVTLPIDALLAWHTAGQQFAARTVATASMVAALPLRPVTVIGYAALLLALPGHRWRTALAAAGRVALSNYLLCSLAFTALFYGWGGGQFAHWDRARLYVLIPPAWAAMLLWPHWWLARFHYGPVEWVWRMATRIERIPLRR